MDALSTLIALVIGLALGALIVFALKRGKSRELKTEIHSDIQSLRSIGELSVFKVITKEIVTETDHTFGEFGRKYLSWVLSKKKMAMIFEFEIDFRYDLRRPEFQIHSSDATTAIIRMPPCFYEVHIRDIHFYDEQKAKLMPWLLPDLLNGFFSDGFSEQDKNRLVAAARAHAQDQAVELINKLQSEVQQSAKTTMLALAKAFKVENVAIEFTENPKRIDLSVDLPQQLAA
jgi:Protein of unknown function (DUF4230)